MFASIVIVSHSVFDVTIFSLNKLQHFNFLQKPHCLRGTAQKGGLGETGDMGPLDKEGLFPLLPLRT